MILLAFLSYLLVFFFVNDQIASFQLKQIIVFLNLVFSVCVYFIAWLWPSLIIEFSTTGSELYCMQLIVWKLNMITIEKNKAVLYHADISNRDRGGGEAGRAIALPLFCWDLFSRALADMEKITCGIIGLFPKRCMVRPCCFRRRGATLACNWVFSGAPNENIVQNHLNIALLNALIFSIWTVDIGIFLSPKNISSVRIS